MLKDLKAPQFVGYLSDLLMALGRFRPCIHPISVSKSGNVTFRSQKISKGDHFFPKNPIHLSIKPVLGGS